MAFGKATTVAPRLRCLLERSPPGAPAGASGPGASALARPRSTVGRACVSAAYSAGEAGSEGAHGMRRGWGGVGIYPEGGTPQAAGTCPRQNQNDTRLFVGSVGPSAAVSSEDWKKK